MIRPTYLIIRHDALNDPIVLDGNGEALMATLKHYHSENGCATFDVYELKDASARTYEYRTILEHRTLREAPSKSTPNQGTE